MNKHRPEFWLVVRRLAFYALGRETILSDVFGDEGKTWSRLSLNDRRFRVRSAEAFALELERLGIGEPGALAQLRSAAGVVAVGNGAQGDQSGTLAA